MLEELELMHERTVSDRDFMDRRQQRLLGLLIKAEFHTDFFVLYRCPRIWQPFDTMPDPEDEVTLAVLECTCIAHIY